MYVYIYLFIYVYIELSLPVGWGHVASGVRHRAEASTRGLRAAHLPVCRSLQ